MNFFSLLIIGLTTITASVAPPTSRIPIILAGLYLSRSPRQISEWERGILLRFGRFKRVLSPGISWVIPGVDQLKEVVDLRIRATSFSAEKALTQDTVPVNVDAVLFWQVTDAKQAVIAIEDFSSTINWAAQTTLRDVIGQTELVRMISDRESVDDELRRIIGDKTQDWGIRVRSVEIRDMKIPGKLEDAMSRKAQADREREARLILAESEVKIAEEMERAAQIYDHAPISLQIRAMNMTYESIKERGALMVIPSEMVSSMGSSVMSLGMSSFERTGAGASTLTPTSSSIEEVTSHPHPEPTS